MLLHGLGWTRMPKHIIDSELKSGQLIPIEIEKFTLQSQLSLFMIHL